MENKSNYYDLLKHPKWQEKRLRVMENRGFECECCGSKDKQLNIHHNYYKKGSKPWEYKDIDLSCLCDECHKKYHKIQSFIQREMALLELGDKFEIVGYVIGMNLKNYPSGEYKIKSEEEAQGIANCWGIDVELVKSAIKKNKTNAINGYMLNEIEKEGNG